MKNYLHETHNCTLQSCDRFFFYCSNKYNTITTEQCTHLVSPSPSVSTFWCPPSSAVKQSLTPSLRSTCLNHSCQISGDVRSERLMICNGTRTGWSPVWSVIIQMIKKIREPRISVIIIQISYTVRIPIF